MAEEEEANASKEAKDGTENEAGSSWYGWSSWGQSILKNISDKSATTLEMVRKDFSEFYSTIQADTAAVVADTATKVQEQLNENEEEIEQHSTMKSVKKGFSTVLSSVSESLKHLAEAGAQTTLLLESRGDQDSASTSYDRREAIIYAIQTNPATYCNEPDGPPDAFKTWLEEFDSDAKRGEISDLLVQNTEIRAIYIQLVPNVVSHSTFWQRYYYKLHQVEQDESRRAALVARASVEQVTDECYGWGDDDDDSQEQNEKGKDGPKQSVDKKHMIDVTPTAVDADLPVTISAERTTELQMSSVSIEKDPINSIGEAEADILPKNSSQLDAKKTPITDTVLERSLSSGDDIQQLDEESSSTTDVTSKTQSEKPVEKDTKTTTPDDVEDDDFDIDLELDDDDVNEEEIAEMIAKIKSSDDGDPAEDDDDWESWQ